MKKRIRNRYRDNSTWRKIHEFSNLIIVFLFQVKHYSAMVHVKKRLDSVEKSDEDKR